MRIRTQAQGIGAIRTLTLPALRLGSRAPGTILTESWLCVKSKGFPIRPASTCDQVGDAQQKPGASFRKLPDCHLSLTPLVDAMTPGSNQVQPEKEIMATEGQEFWENKGQKVSWCRAHVLDQEETRIRQEKRCGRASRGTGDGAAAQSYSTLLHPVPARQELSL